MPTHKNLKVNYKVDLLISVSVRYIKLERIQSQDSLLLGIVQINQRLQNQRQTNCSTLLNATTKNEKIATYSKLYKDS